MPGSRKIRGRDQRFYRRNARAADFLFRIPPYPPPARSAGPPIAEKSPPRTFSSSRDEERGSTSPLPRVIVLTGRFFLIRRVPVPPPPSLRRLFHEAFVFAVVSLHSSATRRTSGQEESVDMRRDYYRTRNRTVILNYLVPGDRLIYICARAGCV